MNETLWLVINTLESIQLVSTESNLSKMLAAITTLKKMANDTANTENGGEVNG